MGAGVHNDTSYTNCNRFFYEYAQYDIPYSLHMTVFVCLLVILVPAIFTNAFTIAVLRKKEQLKLTSNILLLHTSVCDVMFGAIAMPLWASHLASFLFNTQNSCLHQSFATFFAQLLPWMTFLTTFLIAFDRHIAISRPYFYDIKVQGNHLLYPVILTTMWIVMIAINVSSFFVDDHLPVRCISFMIPLLSAYSVYAHISTYVTVKKTKRKIHCNNLRVSYKEARKRKASVREAKVARLTGYMLLSLSICYLPYFGLQFASVFTDPLSSRLYAALSVSELTCGIKCIVNPVLYYKSKRVVRVQVRDSVRKITNTLNLLRTLRAFSIATEQTDDLTLESRVVRVRSAHHFNVDDKDDWQPMHRTTPRPPRKLHDFLHKELVPISPFMLGLPVSHSRTEGSG